ncbi:hypothetical protein NSTC745_06336 [Nostoc sp. DSM 114161]|jgi:hypothetical protein|uniref:hypothetical protein n=1 Tax=Nostoc sp. DSM 114161 TaxID=3440143 RepID=UPI0040464884
MKYSLSNEKLVSLSEQFHVMDGETARLIRLLWQVREFQENTKSEQLLRMAMKMDDGIAIAILQQLSS